MKLPRVTGEKVISALRKAGFEVVGIRGSHHYLYCAQHDVIVTVPVHSKKILAPRTLQAILFQAGITVDRTPGTPLILSTGFSPGACLHPSNPELQSGRGLMPSPPDAAGK
ncbi:type II toxin-antitoxin system HicA family toxin [Methanoculleus sp. 10]|jgi:predicted RNA binding protein YcfA (HicA-like mRNA interferase family)|uniref:type II toxin-antitoxin system HicA family toxin n=1 Tax=Methanoculleus sp. 10 TaxID=430615 RepID=UPI0025CB8665|nr:type II toxin-antitoxin system HicA family toxin [Methanoculleus sp. 10]